MAQALDADLGRERRVEARERRVGDRAAGAGVELEVDLARIEHPLDEPHRRAVDVLLELGDREPLGRGQALAQLRVAHVRVAPGGGGSARQLALPAGRGGDRRRPVGVVAQAAGQGAQALAIRRRLVERVGDVRQPAAVDQPRRVVSQHAHDLGPERRGLERLSLLGRRLPGERQPGPRAGAGDREQVPLDFDRVGPADAERLGGIGIEDLALGRRTGQAALLQAEHERRLEAARAGPAQVEHGHPSRL